VLRKEEKRNLMKVVGTYSKKGRADEGKNAHLSIEVLI